MSKVIGIDLGTTNSCVSIVEGGTPKVIASSENLLTTPSVVAYKGDQIITGAPAKRQAVTNPKGTVTAAKRLIGRRADDPELVSKKEMFNDMIIENKNGDAWLSVDGNKVSPQQVSAQILMKMKKTAEDYLGESVSRAVITVPAYFNDAQRQATKDAGKIAGLEVERIINEPTAAALAYGLDKEGVEGKYLVYDLGGGTFDVSIIEIAQIDGETQFEVLSTAGDTLLGGEDFDMCIVNWLVDEFKAAQGIDLRSDTYSMQRLKEAAERAKIELTTAPQTEINLPYITGDQESGPKHLVQTLSKPKMEDLTRDLVEKTIEPVKRALKDAGLKNSDIKDTILVGGQTRMQLVRDRVKQFMGKQPRLDINPDEAVAIGAAVQGAVLSGDRTDVLLLDVTPLSLGLETQGGVSTILIERNTTIPTSKTQIFSTAVDNQPAVTISVVQGERKKASENSQLGRFDLTDIAAAPRGMPQIEVTFDIDANGILNVSAKDKNTGKSNSVVIQGSSGLDQSEVERMVEEARKHESEDEAFEQLITLRNQGESLVYEGRKTLKELGSEVAEEDQKATRKTLDELEELLKGEDKQSIEDAIKNCGEALQPIMQAAATKKASESTEKGPAKNGGADKDEDIVDASFDEVDD